MINLLYRFLLWLDGSPQTDQFCKACGNPTVWRRRVDEYDPETGTAIYIDEERCVFGHFRNHRTGDPYILVDGKRKPLNRRNDRHPSANPNLPPPPPPSTRKTWR